MNKKVLLQILMLFFILFISLLFFSKYFKEKRSNINQTSQERGNNVENVSTSNFTDDIKYKSTDQKGNKYEITAQQAEIDIKNTEIMFLINVVAYVYMKDSDTIKIVSDYGKYNSKNYDTIFSKNVIVTYPGHTIKGDYLDFSLVNSLGTMSKNIIYNSEKTSLFADMIEIDLTTKDSKIFMNDNKKKVFIEGTR